MTQQERFGKRLRQLRREKSAREHRDVEQGEVAGAIGDTQSNVARWEKGRIPKDDETIRRLADFYGVSFAWLRTGEGVEQAAPESLDVGAGGMRKIGERVPLPEPVTSAAKAAKRKRG